MSALAPTQLLIRNVRNADMITARCALLPMALQQRLWASSTPLMLATLELLAN